MLKSMEHDVDLLSTKVTGCWWATRLLNTCFHVSVHASCLPALTQVNEALSEVWELGVWIVRSLLGPKHDTDVARTVQVRDLVHDTWRNDSLEIRSSPRRHLGDRLGPAAIYRSLSSMKYQHIDRANVHQLSTSSRLISSP